MNGRQERQQRFGSLTSAQVAQLDSAAAEVGVSVMQLMEIAGWQVARCAWLLLDEQPGAVLVVAGTGNNGGDGLVAARHLATWGCHVTVRLVGDIAKLKDVIAAHLQAATHNGAEIDESPDVAAAITASQPALVLDGILGTGLNAAPRDPQASAIRALNRSGRRVLAIDVPSGMDATSGQPYDPCIDADATCTLAAMKAGLWTAAAAGAAGEIWVTDIGMPLAAWTACGLTVPAAVRGGVLLPVPSATEP